MSNREVMQQALDALELSAVTVDSFKVQQATQDAITALRTALEQQAEPVAWMVKLGDVTCFQPHANSKYASVPLYTTPPQRKPLTDQQILNIHALRCWPRTMFADKSYGIALDTVTVKDFTRAIEQAHGIKEGT